VSTHWKLQEDKFLIENYGSLTRPEIAIRLNRTYGSVDWRLTYLRRIGALDGLVPIEYARPQPKTEKGYREYKFTIKIGNRTREDVKAIGKSETMALNRLLKGYKDLDLGHDILVSDGKGGWFIGEVEDE